MKKTLILFAITALLSAGTASAGEGQALGIKGSTLGAGLELTMGMNSSLDMRLLASGLNYTKNGTQSNVNYNGKLKLFTMGAIADYRPFSGSFRTSAGLFYDGNKLDLVGVPATGASYNINGVTYTAAQAGSVSAKVDFQKVAPYLGIGWDNVLNDGSPFGVSFDLGALYQGTAKTSMTASGAAANPLLAADVAAEQVKLQDSLKNYKWWPVIAFGVSYRF